MDGLMDRFKNGWTDKLPGWINRWTEWWIYGQTDKLMKGWMNEGRNDSFAIERWVDRMTD